MNKYSGDFKKEASRLDFGVKLNWTVNVPL
jgi:hypothetical protein